ncbi:NucA/NucB deoxyribonuclease domain-containing protein [Nocardia farcinica]|uniref:NucA/NucB deoxyribonuclease domain-containing protein n=1 Tax=Nocardia farcinica TaxID=37329 RepID=UPI003CC7F296
MEPAVHPEAVGHVQRAQQSGLPGGAGSPLHRQASVSERNNNRRVSCPRGNAVGDARKVPGRSCDEYPFASTREGAASNPNGRPFNPECHVPDLGAATGPTGYSVCMIDNPQKPARRRAPRRLLRKNAGHRQRRVRRPGDRRNITACPIAMADRYQTRS